MINWEYLASLDFSVAWTYREALLRGLGVSLAYTGLATVLGLALAVLTASAVRSRLAVVRFPTIGFVELFRNTPLLVQLVWVHFALPQLTGLNLTILQSGLLAITLNVAAYFSEILRAGIDAIPKGQWEAAHSLGLHPWSIWRFVILPQAIRIVYPPLASMILSLFKGTSVLSILAISELMRLVTNISTHTARPVEIFTVGAILYFCCGALMTRGFSVLERRIRLRTG